MNNEEKTSHLKLLELSFTSLKQIYARALYTLKLDEKIWRKVFARSDD